MHPEVIEFIFFSVYWVHAVAQGLHHNNLGHIQGLHTLLVFLLFHKLCVAAKHALEIVILPSMCDWEKSDF